MKAMAHPCPVLLSHFQARPLLEARRDGRASAKASLDLGLTERELRLRPDGVALPDGRSIPWRQIEEAASSPTACFLLENGGLRKVQRYSPAFDRVYTLYPTAGAPTLLVSGIPMHRIKGTDPWEDAGWKLRAAGPVSGLVLDTATGLGYTAIQAAKTAQRVVTVELDPEVLEIARVNPWSRELFENPKIERRAGDSFDEVQRFPDAAFDVIIHDPPVFSLAGELYSAEFYRRLLRVLRPGGRLFHYIGDPQSRMGGGVTRGVVRRLREAGFGRVERRPRAFGVTARR